MNKSIFDFTYSKNDPVRNVTTDILDAMEVTFMIICLSLTGWFWGPMYTIMKIREAKIESDYKKRRWREHEEFLIELEEKRKNER